ncbi:MAG: threonine--tRNA ligase [Firmicutes bacterium]|nr:threonine--tRNA ligase [Bacillota bacterium]
MSNEFIKPDEMQVFWHTTSHILAHAVKRLYPEVKLAIGPATDSGFYYDFDTKTPFTADDLGKIEKEMKRIIKEGLPIERFELEKSEALEFVKGEPYKIELIEGIPAGEAITFYRQGDFADLCAGPHLGKTSAVKAYKLLSVTGAYWRGDEKNKMLQRIYGVSFPDRQQLDEHLHRLEEAKKRDHNRLGRELELFTTSEYIGQGLPILMPKGARIMQILQRFVEDEEEKRGYQLTKTPFMAKSDLYKISGHWDHYRDGMFIMGKEGDKEIFALRPMTCPFQFQAYLSKMRSYRDLPIRYNETATLFRNEASGEMHGLIRVRQFTLSEGHIVCTPEQLEDEFRGSLDLASFMLKTLGLDEDVSFRFSKWDAQNREKYIGSPEQWENTQNIMRSILDRLEINYVEAEGEAAFYGPKLDIQIKNVHGKEDTLITIQVDFQLAERFEMEYIDADGQKKHPYIVHRSSIGCYERTLALLIEKYAGAFPLWLAPVQVKVLPISEKHFDYAEAVAARLQACGFRVEKDTRNEKIGYKIREAQKQKVPYMLIAGDKEEEQGTVSVRSRKDGELGTLTLDEFITAIQEEIKNKTI